MLSSYYDDPDELCLFTSILMDQLENRGHYSINSQGGGIHDGCMAYISFIYDKGEYGKDTNINICRIVNFNNRAKLEYDHYIPYSNDQIAQMKMKQETYEYCDPEFPDNLYDKIDSLRNERYPDAY
jgi:hypothetical protein